MSYRNDMSKKGLNITVYNINKSTIKAKQNTIVHCKIVAEAFFNICIDLEKVKMSTWSIRTCPLYIKQHTVHASNFRHV